MYAYLVNRSVGNALFKPKAKGSQGVCLGGKLYKNDFY